MSTFGRRGGVAMHDQMLAQARDAITAGPRGFVLFTIERAGDDMVEVTPLTSLPAISTLPTLLRGVAHALELSADILEAEMEEDE